MSADPHHKPPRVLQRSVFGLLGMIMLAGMGERVGDRFLPEYLSVLGGGVLAVSIYAMLKNLLGALYSLPGGWLSDLLGTRRALLLFNLIAIAGYAVAALAPNWPLVLAGAALFIAWSAISLPATMELLAAIVPKDRRAMGVSLVSLIRRVPMALGPLLGGFLLTTLGVQTGMRVAFCFAIILTLVGIFLQQWMIPADKPRAAMDDLLHPLTVLRDMSPSMRHLLVSDILIRFCEQIPDAFVVLWCLHFITSPVHESQFGMLTVIEMSTAVLCYIPVAYLADRGHKKPFVLITFCFFTAFPIVLMHAQSWWPLVIAFIVRGLKEFGEATRKALIMDLAPPDRKAAYFGVYYLLRDVIVSFAALAGGALWAIDPTLNLWTAAAFGTLGTLRFAYFGRDLPPSSNTKKSS